MKKLKTKTYITIYSLLTTFLILILAIYNIQNYNQEYHHIKDNLSRMLKREPERMDNRNIEPKNSFDPNLENRIVFDYEMYTVLLDNDNNIFDIISHSFEESNFDANKIALNIINNNSKDSIKINNLYFKGYSYNYKNGEYIVIINTSNIATKLDRILINSIIIFIILEIVILIVTKYITNWLVKPAIDSFNKQKDFIADASHELKTPLAVIMASTDTLKTDIKDNKYLDNIANESERMNKLIKSLLDLSKLENENICNNYEINNLSKIVNKSVLTFEGIAFENKLKIKTNIKDNIKFKCNGDEISELLGILLDNAIKHSNKTKPIEVNLDLIKDKIILEVINTGDEIKEEDLNKIFERFYRVDKARNRSENRYGLGLAIAKSIVLNHGGNISATSNNKVTTFKVMFKK